MITSLTTTALAATLLACFEPAEETETGDGSTMDGGAADGGSADGGTTGDTGSDGLAFEVVVEGLASPSCGPAGKPPATCDEAGLAVLVADDQEQLDALFAELVPVEAPDVDLDEELVMLSYLAQCPSKSDRLVVDRITVDGTTLLVDELRTSPKWQDAAVACLYNVVTFPRTDFETVVATLTVVAIDE